MKTQFTKTAFLLLAILFFACGDDDSSSSGNPSQIGKELYLRLELNGAEQFHVTGTRGEFHENPILATISTAEDGVLEPHSVQVTGGLINEEGTGYVKTLSLVLKNITAPGTYDLLEQEGEFVYSISDSSGGHVAGYSLFVPENGSGTVTIEEISDKVRPGIGKPVKGTFSIWISFSDKEIYNLTGEFNGGV